MLVISRHRDESFRLGDCLTVQVVDIRGDKVRLGIEAPRAMPVHREEVYQAIKREQGTTERPFGLDFLYVLQTHFSNTPSPAVSLGGQAYSIDFLLGLVAEAIKTDLPVSGDR